MKLKKTLARLESSLTDNDELRIVARDLGHEFPRSDTTILNEFRSRVSNLSNGDEFVKGYRAALLDLCAAYVSAIKGGESLPTDDKVYDDIVAPKSKKIFMLGDTHHTVDTRSPSDIWGRIRTNTKAAAKTAVARMAADKKAYEQSPEKMDAWKEWDAYVTERQEAREAIEEDRITEEDKIYWQKQANQVRIEIEQEKKKQEANDLAAWLEEDILKARGQ